MTKNMTYCDKHVSSRKCFFVVIGALVRRRDGDTSVIWIVDIDFCNKNNKNSKVAIDKIEHKWYCNA